MAFCARTLLKAAVSRKDKRIQCRKYEFVDGKEMRINGLSRKAQVAMEYMILVGFLVVITIPLILVYNTQYRGTSQQIIANQADQIGQKIVDTAESIYYLGQPSKTTVKIYIPEQIESITIRDYEIMFKLMTSKGTDDVVKLSNVPLNGTLPSTSGMHYVTVQSVGGYVNISST